MPTTRAELVAELLTTALDNLQMVSDTIMPHVQKALDELKDTPQSKDHKTTQLVHLDDDGKLTVTRAPMDTDLVTAGFASNAYAALLFSEYLELVMAIIGEYKDDDDTARFQTRINDISSASSRLAQFSGSSSLSNFPAGISMNSCLGPYLYCFIKPISPEGRIGTTQTAPG